ncbi:MAG: hypothetical protein K0B16_11345 [Burkholderiaceae bacterium]|nr:hypothetical protein [Burkholderiaceae bacterium]
MSEQFWDSGVELGNAARLLEMVESANCSRGAKHSAEEFILSGTSSNCAKLPKGSYSNWPPNVDGLSEVSGDLIDLSTRVRQRVRSQSQENLLPPKDTDFFVHRYLFISADAPPPQGKRRVIKNQSDGLLFQFRGYPKICHLLSLTISYLRRDTAHTDHARLLFHRIWQEEANILLAILPSRWLISTLQTFLDHGLDEHQRVIGAAGFFYANMIKAYEGERAIIGLPPDAVYARTAPKARIGFPGLDQFWLGRTDLILNTNALLLDVSSRDHVAGCVLREFMQRAMAADSIFSRMDQSRIVHDINTKPFLDCWSFFRKPIQRRNT